MPQRNFRNYVGLSRLGRTNNRYSIESCKGVPKPPAPSMLNKLQEFLTSNVFGWFIHDWRVPRAFEYPAIDDSSYPMNADGEIKDEIKIAVAADWATDTIQSQWVGESMEKKEPDYTIHLGDTYFSGAPDELEANFGKGKSGKDKSGKAIFYKGNWPRGRYGSFALCGNHEMFSSGYPYLAMITNPLRGFGSCTPGTNDYTGQESPNFCLYNDHWILLGLDTGYQSLNRGILQLNPTNENLKLPDSVVDWVCQKVKNLPGEKRRAMIVLSHHQYITAFHEETEFHNPAHQLKKLFPDSEGILWIWGHEHRFSIYGKKHIDAHHITAYGRCIGNGGMPDEHTGRRHVIDAQARDRKLVVYDERTADSIPLSSNPHAQTQKVGFNGYAIISLKNEKATITYHAAYKKNSETEGADDPVFQESWTSVNGQLVFDLATDMTSTGSSATQLNYFGEQDPRRVGR